MSHLDDELLDRYSVGELNPAERALVCAHLADCAACRRALDELSALDKQLSALRPVPLADDLSGPVLERIAATAWYRSPLLAGGLLTAQLTLVPLLALQLAPVLATLLGLVGAWSPLASAPSVGLPADIWTMTVTPPTIPSAPAWLAPSLPLTTWTAAMAGGAVLWLVGLRWLLGRPVRGGA